ncbi:MAG TPA: VTT domain-containing protein [Chloroflexota bacterium]|nr:VTT domain-containing protein [Chloroflexota bacterium]
MNLDLAELLRSIVASIGPLVYLAVFFVLFAESGLFFGFFLPGDSLLFTLGLLASQQVLSLPVMLLLWPVAAVTGDSVGYWFGERYGRRLFTREDSIWFHKKHLVTAHDFYEKHGGKAIVLARFIPAVRTFVPIVAGMAQMSYRKFLFWNLLGGIGWSLGVTIAGYFLGSIIPDVDKYLIPIVLLIILVSALPPVIHLYKERRSGAAA